MNGGTTIEKADGISVPSPSTTASGGDVVDRHRHRPGCFDAEEHAQQRLAVRQPADTEVAEERLRGDVAELDLLVQIGLLQPEAVLNKNSYAAPKQPALCVAATTMSPGSSR